MSTNTSLSYVRKEMLDQQPAPRSQVGVSRWIRENLFSGWINSILTLVSIYVIFIVLKGTLPWIFGGVWDANSLDECRQILTERFGETHHACWAVIRERWNQLIYGFYPETEYWRANLAFVLMLLALAPVLFDKLPRKMLWITMAFPFFMVWLVWGGTIWGVASVAIGFGLIYAAGKLVGNSNGLLLATLAAVLVFLLYFGDPISMILNLIGSVHGWLSGSDVYYTGQISLGGDALSIRSIFPLREHLLSFLNGTLPIEALHLQEVQSRDLGGFMICLIIGLSGIALSLPIGIVLALGRQSDLFIVKTICVGFIEFIRGVPLITLLFTASLLLNYFLPPGTTFDLTLRVIIMVTMFSSAYMAEVIRGGLAALPKGQYEAADALGLDYWKAQRLIIMPQALKISIPGIVNTFIGLFKDTTLVMFIGIYDMLGLSNAIRANAAWNGIYWELFIFIGLVFWICCFAMSRYSQWLERKLRTDHR